MREGLIFIIFDWFFIEEDFVIGVNGIVVFIGESRGECVGFDILKGVLYFNLVRSFIKWCCCL